MSSIFGSSNQSSENRFSNLMVNFPQQQQQQNQTNSSIPSSQEQARAQSLMISDGTNQSFQQPLDENKPSWFNNPRKRTIPQAIVKRSTKPSSSDTSSTNGNSTSSSTTRSGFGAITFGSRKSANVFNPANPKADGSDSLASSILIDSNEAPPTKTLYDWQREDEFGSTVPLHHPDDIVKNTTFGLNRTAEPTMRNVFDKTDTVLPSTHEANQKKQATASSANSGNESAVLVFGYPESISNQVIIHFSKFGNILEDFEVLRGASGINAATLRLRRKHANDNKIHRKYPIFTGDGWIKLTYDSPSSALRALQENGIVYGGCLIGCVPYSKNAVEQLASCKIDKTEDIGATNFSTPLALPTSINGLSGGKQEDNGNEPSLMEAANTSDQKRFNLSTQHLDIKDGKTLFVTNVNNSGNNHNFLKTLEEKMKEQNDGKHKSNGVLGVVNNWLFGWNDL